MVCVDGLKYKSTFLLFKKVEQNPLGKVEPNPPLEKVEPNPIIFGFTFLKGKFTPLF
jgi:hypothetical protein